MGFPSLLQALMPFTAFFGGKCGKFQKKVKENSRLLLAYKCICKDGYVWSGKKKCVAMYIPPYTSRQPKKQTTQMNTAGNTSSTTERSTTRKTTKTSTTEISSTRKTTLSSTTKRSTTRKTTLSSTTRRSTTSDPGLTTSSKTSWWPTQFPTKKRTPKNDNENLNMKDADSRFISEKNDFWSTSETAYHLDIPEATTVSLPDNFTANTTQIAYSAHIMKLVTASTMTTAFSGHWYNLVAGDY
ncbi:A-agglutinin anchorage subunit-like [Drosophila obscura]|uniref:A-agglutinin anchorage subunit-like n=1 Tax=Drosophila obscura TaxID=7282 RepID=UPI001BB2175B|nr:A-agglutinin anchorage subunit-like [Drosophila obscura]